MIYLSKYFYNTFVFLGLPPSDTLEKVYTF